MLFHEQVHDLVLHIKAHLLAPEALEAHTVVPEVVIVALEVFPVVREVLEVFPEVLVDPAVHQVAVLQDPVVQVQDLVAEDDSSPKGSVKHAKL